jgi:FtsP/CotA-like multicopper oxidase with cupredoxin domain
MRAVCAARRARLRRYVCVAGASALVTLLVMTQVSPPAGVGDRPVAQRLDPSSLARGHAALARAASPEQPPQVREFTLDVVEAQVELAPGITVRAWTFNGQLPGPELRVREGDTVRVLVRNHLPVPTSVHWHGVDVPNAMDGVPGVTQEAIPPEGSFTYEFVARPAGTRWYHSHQDPEVQVPLGLYGPLIIEPREPAPGQAAPAPYARDYTIMLGEWALGLTPEVATGAAGAAPLPTHSKEVNFDFFLMNGRIGDAIPPLQIKPGERIRIRLINAGSLVHSIHLHGHQFKLIATDGNPVPPAAQLLKDTVTIGPAERYDLEVSGTNPGIWMLHCHMEHHMANGMMTFLVYDGAQPAAHLHGPVPGAPSASADPALAGALVTMTDNRYTPASLTVPAGTTVAWTNQGANVHTITSLDGLFDSGAVKPGDSFAYTFTRPGTYRYICRQHLLNGMVGTITVQ